MGIKERKDAFASGFLLLEKAILFRERPSDRIGFVQGKQWKWHIRQVREEKGVAIGKEKKGLHLRYNPIKLDK